MLNRVPQPPHWKVNPDESPGWVEAMKQCPQHPDHHGEGDVWTHTRMVLECLVADPEFRQLGESDRRILYVAGLLHDIAKPACTQPDLGSPGHARKGSQQARQLLYRAGLPWQEREAVCNLVRHHMVPYRLVDRPDWQTQLLALCLTTRWDWLRLLSRADARGRICSDQSWLLDQIEMFSQLAQENPPRFADDHSRVTYFRKGGDPDRQVFDTCTCTVVLTSGLPAAGKDYYLSQHLSQLPMISLDALREELDVRPDQGQGPVLQAARERARQLLRARKSFVWNATNLSFPLRERTLSLCHDYGARLSMVYCEAPLEEIERRNAARPRPVPTRVLERMMELWEPPNLTEAHQITYQCS
ncbi:AAA family ATPase [bacterium]|nr:AAA family ATPase [bacterium]